VFFDTADGTNGGMPFAVYDSKTLTKVFGDSYYDRSMWNIKVESSPFNYMRVFEEEDGQFSLKYLRVVEAKCDLHREKVACWDRVRKKLTLQSTDLGRPRTD